MCRKRNNYGERLTAFFNPHASGNHTFFVTSDDEGGLWFSSGNNITNVNSNKYITSEIEISSSFSHIPNLPAAITSFI